MSASMFTARSFHEYSRLNGINDRIRALEGIRVILFEFYRIDSMVRRLLPNGGALEG